MFAWCRWSWATLSNTSYFKSFFPISYERETVSFLASLGLRRTGVNWWQFELRPWSVNVPKNAQSTATPPQKLRHSHDPTSPSIHDFLVGGKGDSQLWQVLAGAIHNLDPWIHKLIHNFWQEKGSNGDLWAEIAILTVRSFAESAPLSTLLPLDKPPASMRPPHCQYKHARNDGPLLSLLPYQSTTITTTTTRQTSVIDEPSTLPVQTCT